MKKNKLEASLLGAAFESKDIFEKVEELNKLNIKSKITDEELEDRISEFEECDDEFRLEMSVIKRYNKNGHDSYCWGDADKIILWDSNGTVCTDMYIGDTTWCKGVADLL